VLKFASGEPKQRKGTNCCVPKAQGESLKGGVPAALGVRIATAWRRDHCLPSWQKPEAENPDPERELSCEFHAYLPVYLSPAGDLAVPLKKEKEAPGEKLAPTPFQRRRVGHRHEPVHHNSRRRLADSSSSNAVKLIRPRNMKRFAVVGNVRFCRFRF